MAELGSRDRLARKLCHVLLALLPGHEAVVDPAAQVARRNECSLGRPVVLDQTRCR
jgi:hypothetical protein